MGNCYNLSKSPQHNTLETMIKSNKMNELNNDVLKLDMQNDDDGEIKKKGEEAQKSRKTNVMRQKDGTIVTTTVIQHNSNGFDDDDAEFEDKWNQFGKKDMFKDFEKDFDKYDNKGNRNNKAPAVSNEHKIEESSDEDDDYQKGKVGANGKGNSEQSSQEFINDSLRAHNDLRAKHSSPPLKINNQLNQIAQKYAETIARSSNFAHSDNEYKGDPLGENLYMCNGYAITGKNMSQAWYDEIKDYNFKKGGPSSGTGHFTQLIWADSQEVGFGFAKARDGSYYGVANYYPAGNYQGEYQENVKPKRN